jgi:hypothetical protein
MTTRLERPVRRLVPVHDWLVQEYVVKMSTAGVSFRRPRSRHPVHAPWSSVLRLAERLAGEEAHREQLRAKALRRIGR